jgi:hypothetical protein
VTSDGFTGLRALITPSGRRRRSTSPFGMESAGRWTVLWSDRPGAESMDSPAEAIAPVLLRRYGVVFRRLLDREPNDVAIERHRPRNVADAQDQLGETEARRHGDSGL